MGGGVVLKAEESQEMFGREYESDMVKLDEYIDEAYTHIEKATEELWMKHDTFSACMDREAFNALILEKLKELM